MSEKKLKMSEKKLKQSEASVNIAADNKKTAVKHPVLVKTPKLSELTVEEMKNLTEEQIEKIVKSDEAQAVGGVRPYERVTVDVVQQREILRVLQMHYRGAQTRKMKSLSVSSQVAKIILDELYKSTLQHGKHISLKEMCFNDWVKDHRSGSSMSPKFHAISMEDRTDEHYLMKNEQQAFKAQLTTDNAMKNRLPGLILDVLESSKQLQLIENSWWIANDSGTLTRIGMFNNASTSELIANMLRIDGENFFYSPMASLHRSIQMGLETHLRNMASRRRAHYYIQLDGAYIDELGQLVIGDAPEPPIASIDMPAEEWASQTKASYEKLKATKGGATMLRFLRSLIQDEDTLETLLQLCGSSLILDQSLTMRGSHTDEKYGVTTGGLGTMLLLSGPGATGKSSLLKMIRAALGEDNSVNLQLSSLGREYYTHLGSGPLLAIDEDVSVPYMNDEVIGAMKLAAEHGELSSRQIYSSPTTVKWTAKIMASTNSPLQLEDKSNAMLRRITEIKLLRTLTEDTKRDLGVILSMEGSETTKDAIKMLRFLIFRAYMKVRETLTIEESDEIKKSRAMSLSRINNATTFIEDNYDGRKLVLADEAYRSYAEEMRAQDMQALKQTNFGVSFQNAGFEQIDIKLNDESNIEEIYKSWLETDPRLTEEMDDTAIISLSLQKDLKIGPFRKTLTFFRKVE